MIGEVANNIEDIFGPTYKCTASKEAACQLGSTSQGAFRDTISLDKDAFIVEIIPKERLVARKCNSEVMKILNGLSPTGKVINGEYFLDLLVENDPHPCIVSNKWKENVNSISTLVLQSKFAAKLRKAENLVSKEGFFKRHEVFC